MSGKLFKGFTFYVTLMSLTVFPVSNLTGITDLYIGWLGLVFLSYFIIGYYILSIGFLKKFCKWIDKFKKKKKKKKEVW